MLGLAETRVGRFGDAELTTRVLGLAETTAGRLGFARPSTLVLNFANPRVAGAWACRNEGGKAQFCETEH